MEISKLMKVPNVWFLRVNLLLATAMVALGLAGCASTDYQAAMNPPGISTNDVIIPRLTVGQVVTVTFSGLPPGEEIPLQEKPIKDDGSISLPTIGSIQAAGKTAGQLEDDIHARYVPGYYLRLNVTVKTTSDQVFYVAGEVKTPNRVIYVGPTTVTKAIASAGDFTDFADRKHVILTRFNGQRFKLNCDKILDGKEPDPPVYPNDQIKVPRRWY
jgi:polysaccharide export outer membrane protein